VIRTIGNKTIGVKTIEKLRIEWRIESTPLTLPLDLICLQNKNDDDEEKK